MLAMVAAERLVPKRSDMESWNEPPLGSCSFSRSRFKSRPRLLLSLKLCCWPPVGLPRASVREVTVGVIPCSSSHARVRYLSLNRCWRGRISWNGVFAKARVPAGALEVSWARAAVAPPRSARMVTATHLREITTSVSRTWSDCPPAGLLRDMFWQSSCINISLHVFKACGLFIRETDLSAKLVIKFHHDGVIDDQADPENKTKERLSIHRKAEHGKDGKGSEESRPREGRVGHPSPTTAGKLNPVPTSSTTAWPVTGSPCITPATLLAPSYLCMPIGDTISCSRTKGSTHRRAFSVGMDTTQSVG